MKKILLTRLVDNGKQTTSHAVFYDDFKTLAHFDCLELNWNENIKSSSCIPAGTYNCFVRYSEKYDRHLILNGVLNRSLILIHHGNFNHNTEGCILLGEGFKDIDNDGMMDVLNSKKSIDKLMSFIKNDEVIELTIQKALIKR